MGVKMLSWIVLGILVALPLQASRAEDPPMFAVHDLASGELQKRRTISSGKFCDADFGAELEGIVTEMEQNKDAPAAIAQKLEEQFKGIMERNANKFLCQKSLWCDLGECKKSPSQPARSLRSDNDPAPAPAELSRAKKADADIVNNADTRNDTPDTTGISSSSKSSSDSGENGGTETTTPKTSAATTNRIAVLSFVIRFTLLSIIAQVIPLNLGD